MNPDASVKALASIEVDLAAIETGQSITVTWRGKPVFIRRRTEGEIAEARSVAETDMPDPQNDIDRVQKDEWLVMVGICTIWAVCRWAKPAILMAGFARATARITTHRAVSAKDRHRKNLEIPSYEFVGDSRIKIG